MRVGVIERAFQMAQSGQFQNLVELQKQLSREGYEAVYTHLSGKQTKTELTRMMAEAKPAGGRVVASPELVAIPEAQTRRRRASAD